MGEIVLVRHGETEWSLQRRHTGRTDLPLTEQGETQARQAKRLVGDRAFALALSSPLQRALRTAELAGLAPIEVDERLAEWDYGAYEGRTTDEIRRSEGPDWSIWTARIAAGDSPGEQLADLGARVTAVLERVRAAARSGDVAVVAHGHVLRVLTSCYLGLGPAAGQGLALDAGSVSVLGDEHGAPVVNRWNLDPAVTERLT